MRQRDVSVSGFIHIILRQTVEKSDGAAVAELQRVVLKLKLALFLCLLFPEPGLTVTFTSVRSYLIYPFQKQINAWEIKRLINTRKCQILNFVFQNFLSNPALLNT